MKNKIIAVDFDGTLCEHHYPAIGPMKVDVVADLLQETDHGAKVILWTCRTGDRLQEAVDWCKEQGIPISAVNDDLPEIKDTDFGREKSCKVFAHEYWDDRNRLWLGQQIATMQEMGKHINSLECRLARARAAVKKLLGGAFMVVNGRGAGSATASKAIEELWNALLGDDDG